MLSWLQSIQNETLVFQTTLLRSSLSLRHHAHGLLAEHLMHMAHKIGNTYGVLKSSSDWLNYTGFLGDVCRVL